MKILIIGASQGTGALSVRAALGRGHDVTALARHPDRLAIADSRLRKVSGDFHDNASMLAAVVGHDAVIITASATTLRAFRDNPRYFSQGTQHVIDGMKRAGVRRLVVLSALGTGESRRLMPWIIRKIVVDTLLKLPFADHERQETQVRASDLEWIIARPGRLTNGPARNRYVRHAELIAVPRSISRADVADFLVEAATTDEWVGKAVQIGG